VICGPLVPAVPSCILDPLREQFLALLPARVETHPLGCHRCRIDDRVVFDKLVQVLVYGAGYQRIADDSCSATTLRRRDEWIRLGVWERLRLAALDAYEKMTGLELAVLAVDGCTTRAAAVAFAPTNRCSNGEFRKPRPRLPREINFNRGCSAHARARLPSTPKSCTGGTAATSIRRSR
jgi:transposase